MRDPVYAMKTYGGVNGDFSTTWCTRNCARPRSIDKPRRRTAIDSQLGSNAGGLFTLHGPTICRSSALLSAGVGVQWNECVSTYVYYNWAATITPATTSTADCGPVSG